MPKPPDLAPIELPLAALEQVTGGTSSPAFDTNALLAQVNDMLGSVKNVTTVSHQQGLQPQEMMLLMMLLQQRNQAAAPVVVAAPWSGRRWY